MSRHTNDNDAGFAPGEAEAIASALEPKIRGLAAREWSRHPRNPMNMSLADIEAELEVNPSRERGASLRAEAEARRANPGWVIDWRERERLEAEAIEGQIGPSGHSPGEVI